MPSLQNLQLCSACNQARNISEFYLKDKVKQRYAKVCKQCQKTKRELSSGGSISIIQNEEYTPIQEFQMVLDLMSTLITWNEEFQHRSQGTILERV